MWGKIVTEATFETNFNTQFPNTKTDVLIHLAQWQYWWWFWFSFLWVLYYLFLARTLRYRTLKFRPKIVSSFRPHGKWGDVIICILPVSWCANILINSNFLLKLLEWQAESSLFTIRIRGKQWYWVYKFDFRNFSDIISTPKNIGNNKWMFSFFGDLKTSDNYLHIIQMRAQNKWIKKYWIKNLGKFEQDEKSNINLIQDFFKIDTFKKGNTILASTNSLDEKTGLTNVPKSLILDLSDTDENRAICSVVNNDLADISLYLNKEDDLNTFPPTDLFLTLGRGTMHFEKSFFDTVNEGTFLSKTTLRNNLFLNSFKLLLPTQEDLFTKNISFLKNNFNFVLKDFQNITNDFSYISFLTFSTTNINLSHIEYNYNIFVFQEDSNRVTKSLFGKPTPISLVKFPVTYIDSTGTKLLKFRYNDQNSKVTSRNMIKVPYFVFKQVRYKRRKSAFATAHIFYDSLGNEKSIKKNFSLNNQYSVEQDVKNPTRYYRMFKKTELEVKICL